MEDCSPIPDAAIETAEDEAADWEGEDDADRLVLVPVGVILDTDAQIESSRPRVQCHEVPDNEAFEEDFYDFFVLDSVCLGIRISLKIVDCDNLF